MSIHIQSCKDRVAELEELIHAFMDIHVLTSNTSQSGRRFYYISTGGCDVTITARQHNLLKGLLGETITHEDLTEELVEAFTTPIDPVTVGDPLEPEGAEYRRQLEEEPPEIGDVRIECGAVEHWNGQAWSRITGPAAMLYQDPDV